MYEKFKINNLRKKYLELINYEISYKHYVLFLFVWASWLLEKLQMGVIKQNIN
jgi:hypothetical protein